MLESIKYIPLIPGTEPLELIGQYFELSPHAALENMCTEDNVFLIVSLINVLIFVFFIPVKFISPAGENAWEYSLSEAIFIILLSPNLILFLASLSRK